MRVLVVDDEEKIRNVIREYAEFEGYEIDEACDGMEAVVKCKNNDYDIIIMDIMMPKLDGLDDYVVKPFSPKELMARINAVITRTKNNNSGLVQDKYTFEGLEVDMLGRNVYVDGVKKDLTPKEYELLQYFILNKNIALSREKILNEVWGYDFFGEDRTVDTHVKMLRNNLGKYRDKIVTVRGMGYKFEE